MARNASIGEPLDPNQGLTIMVDHGLGASGQMSERDFGYKGPAWSWIHSFFTFLATLFSTFLSFFAHYFILKFSTDFKKIILIFFKSNLEYFDEFHKKTIFSDEANFQRFSQSCAYCQKDATVKIFTLSLMKD